MRRLSILTTIFFLLSTICITGCEKGDKIMPSVDDSQKGLAISLDIVTKDHPPGSVLMFQADISSKGNPGSIVLLISYGIKDAKTGKRGHYEEESRAIESSLSILKEIDLPEYLQPGNYTLNVSVKYDNMTAEALANFIIPEEPGQSAKEADCSSDSDCGTGGCSGQVCATAERARDIITTCEMKPEYECLSLTSCSCVEGKCIWKENDEFLSCMEDKI